MGMDTSTEDTTATEEACGFAWKQGTAHVGEEGPFHRVTCILPQGHDSIPHVCAEDQATDSEPRVAPLGTPLADEWYSNHENIVALTAWMADNGYNAKDVAYAVEKPWKHADEFLAARQDDNAQ